MSALIRSEAFPGIMIGGDYMYSIGSSRTQLLGVPASRLGSPNQNVAKGDLRDESRASSGAIDHSRLSARPRVATRSP
ncbi:MAG: hypothetical protein NZM29_06120, partial [Nitrospira sp.]|nr:hypothetical protein [Nitrospira sp.]